MVDDPTEISVAAAAVKKLITDAGYAGFVPNLDLHCKEVATAVVEAVEAYRNGKEI